MTDEFSQEEIADFAVEYREEMLRSLGVNGIEHSATFSAPGEKIREMPVETTGAHDEIVKTDVDYRILTDTREYAGESEIAEHEDTLFMTVRRTTGYAAIQSSATLALGWGSIPTPREIRVAEHLNSLTKSDVTPDLPVMHDDASHMIQKQIAPNNRRNDEFNLWIDVKDTSILNTTAIEKCVSSLQTYDNNDQISHIRYREDYDDEMLQYRMSIRGLIIEKYFDNQPGVGNADSWHRVYSGIVDPIEINAKIDAMGYINTKNSDNKEFDTYIVTIPELLRPEHVIDEICVSEPREPPTD